jgi:hypothetical protein
MTAKRKASSLASKSRCFLSEMRVWWSPTGVLVGTPSVPTGSLSSGEHGLCCQHFRDSTSHTSSVYLTLKAHSHYFSPLVAQQIDLIGLI